MAQNQSPVGNDHYSKRFVACLLPELKVARDGAEALRLYHLAAAQGHAEALYWVAVCHHYGRGVRKNKAEAIRWYRRAQAAGLGPAALALMVLGA